MFETVTIVLSVVFLVGGPLAVANGYRIYTAEQRARANRLWRIWIAMSVLESVVGLVCLIWVLTRGLPTIWLFTALTAVPLPLALVQWRMHERMEFTGWMDEWFAGRGSSDP
ncbi:hypothetical protein [Natronorubrum sp. DTA28]|uniref:hypothetical protein n=1 Tax=Natronorubrum sp. DTA28 TaxID=3447019 RepID=UPI003F86788C